MSCCGNKKKSFRPNGKICPNCGYIMQRIHKYNSSEKRTVRYWLCPNKLFNGRPCNTKIEL